MGYMEIVTVYVCLGNLNLLPAPTMVTTIDVVEEELCRRAVQTTPIIRPQTAMLMRLSCVKALPAARPVTEAAIHKYTTLTNLLNSDNSRES